MAQRFFPEFVEFIIGDVATSIMVSKGVDKLKAGSKAFAFGKMSSQDAIRYNKYWENLSNGTHLPPGMTAVEYQKYLYGLNKVDEALALQKVDYSQVLDLRKAASQATVSGSFGINGVVAEIKTGTVWDGINATQPNIDGTKIPKSFVLENVMIGEKEVWVHPNATKHIAELSMHKDFSHLKYMNEQSLLTSFKAAVEKAIPELTNEGGNFVVIGGWELGIDTNSGVIYHALPKVY